MKGVFRVKEQKKISLESLVSEIEKNGKSLHCHYDYSGCQPADGNGTVQRIGQTGYAAQARQRPGRDLPECKQRTDW